jgi:hypothetical protein
MIPQDLNQWLTSGKNKIPISPLTGKAADIHDRSAYVSYDTAVAYAHKHGTDIGFVLTEDDPFAVIDLDETTDPVQIERHKKIYEVTDPAYAELSRSGRGVHIWLKGSLPHGVRRDKVEVYTSARYMIWTGRVLRNGPFVENQELLDRLYTEMGGGTAGQVDLEDADALLDDEKVFDMASRAVNAEKFEQLCRGEWQGDYPSQSEADYALMNMFSFYTRNNEQAKRLFRYSALGKREKAQREQYLNTMLRKIRAEERPLIDFTQLHNGNGATHTVPKQETTFTYPPGFLGELAHYVYDTSTRPVAEVSVAAAIAMCAGIVGRQFNISGTGLNQYLILLAKTGVGKEDGARGVERILRAVREKVPVVDTFVGPGTFASGQAIIRTLDEKPCFFSILGEFGLTLQELSDVNQNSLSRVMRRVFLDLYTKSGQSSVLSSSAYSDKEKNTKTLFAPCMTLFGESVPETFYEGLSIHHIESGLIPRFLILEYEGDRPHRNKNAFTAPPEALVQRMADLAETALRMTANNTWLHVQLDSEAQSLMDKFDDTCDTHIRTGANEAIRQLWNRAHLKALRLSALCSVVDRPHAGMVNAAEAQWAIDIVTGDLERLVRRFEAGDVGEGDSKQNADLERILKEYVKRSAKELDKYGVTTQMHKLNVVSLSYLQRRCIPLSSFRKDRRGARIALLETVKFHEEGGLIEKVPASQAREKFSTGQVLYRITL